MRLHLFKLIIEGSTDGAPAVHLLLQSYWISICPVTHSSARPWTSFSNYVPYCRINTQLQWENSTSWQEEHLLQLRFFGEWPNKDFQIRFCCPHLNVGFEKGEKLQLFFIQLSKVKWLHLYVSRLKQVQN